MESKESCGGVFIILFQKKKINIQFHRKDSEFEKLFNSIDYDSLSLFREIMKDRYEREND